MRHDQFCIVGTGPAKVDLQQFRLVNRLFADAGARCLFTHVLVHPIHPIHPIHPEAWCAEFYIPIWYLHCLSLHPLAEHVRSIEFSNVDILGESISEAISDCSPDLGYFLPYYDKNFVQDWLTSTSSRFKQVKRFGLSFSPHMWCTTYYPFSILAPLSQSSLELRDLCLTMEYEVGESCWAMVSKLTRLRIDGESKYRGAGLSDLQRRRSSQNVQNILAMADNIQHLELHFFLIEMYYAPVSTVLIPWPEDPINESLQSLSLTDVAISAAEQCEIMQSMTNAPRALHLSNIWLTSGYWHEVLDVLGRILANLNAIQIERYLGYWEIMGGSRYLTGEEIDGYVEQPDRFGPLMTLNSRDRAAWTKFLSMESKHHTKGKNHAKRAMEAAVTLPSFQCAGTLVDGSRCMARRNAAFNQQICTWRYTRSTIEVHRVWYCRTHVRQTFSAQTWPWNTAHV